jgi:uncharacterized repeat protein (TIGR03806 family)
VQVPVTQTTSVRLLLSETPVKRLLLLSLVLLASPARGARDCPDLPDGFSCQTVATGLTGATALAVAPDGRLFVCEQTGALRVVKDGALLPRPFVTLAVDSYWERGLIGVALDPDFPKKTYVYLCYVSAKPYPHHVVSRFTARGDLAVPGSEKVLLEGDDQRKLGGFQPAGHQGGPLQFGKDGKLYVALGEQTAGAPAQKLTTLQGKLLRLERDGSIPADNPFVKQTRGKYRSIWALGVRNPFALAFQPGSGRLFFNDVGNARWEEINEGAAGANYGWPDSEGPTRDRRFRGPVHAYDRTVGRCITAGLFYNPGRPQFPAKYTGKYFFADYMDNWIRVLDPDRPDRAEVFATGLAGPVDMRLAPDGSLYVLNRNAWVKDDKFRPHTGSLLRISHTANSGRPAPRIATAPAGQIVAAGESAVFALTAKGAGPLEYQWLRDNHPIPGATAARLTLSSVQLGDSGRRLRCVVSNRFGSVKSPAAVLRVLALRPAQQPPRCRPELKYEYFEGTWDYLPVFAELKPRRKGTTAGPRLVPETAREHFGLAYCGFFEADKDGAYTFWLGSSGHAKLFVGETEVVATSPHGRRLASGVIGLKSGRHLFRLLLAHGRGQPDLRLEYAGPGLTRRPVPDALWTHADAAGPASAPRRQTPVTLDVPHDPRQLPPRLSQTGIFRSLADLTPNPGVLPYDVNVPLWSDGARKRRWLALPGDGHIRFAPTGPWRFPAGTVFVKHFEAEGADAKTLCRLETRLLVVDEDGTGYGVTYRWRPDQRDADLLTEGLTEEVTVGKGDTRRQLKWTYPSRGDCLICHTSQAGFVLGVNTRQLHRDQQLRTWSRAGLFESPPREADLPRLSRLAPLNDTTAPLEQRVRSYLDGNCAQCHRPGGARGEFDARFDTPLAKQNLIGGGLLLPGEPRSRLIVPGEPALSEIYRRMARREDAFNMPPLASHAPDREALAVLAQWIRRLRK